jgi:PAS domain S-box-containing protein
VLHAAPDAIVVMDSSGHIEGWNAAAQQIFGHSAEAVIGRELATVIVPGPMRDAHRHALARYLETGEPTVIGRRIEMVASRADGSELRVELTVTSLRDGSTQRFAGFIRPLDDRQAFVRQTASIQKRMAFLAQAGLVLDRSLELDQTLHGLADLTVPDLAQMTVIDRVSPDGTIRTAVAAALNPSHAAALERMRREHPLTATSVHPVLAAIRSRRSQLLGSMTPDYQRQIAQGDEHFQLMRRLRYHSAIVVPLIARRRVLGVLSLLRMEDAPDYGPDDLMLGEELGRRAAMAIDNARLFESTREIAQTLQRSLLPRALPAIDGVTLAARYRASAQGQEVGGDFYDAFKIDGRRWGLAIGDVRGKGPHAAALTALARYTIRALCDRGAAPVLSLLNDAVLREADSLPERFLTAVVAVAQHDGDELVLELSAAGHPAPLILRANGRVQQSAASGMLIGVARDVRYESHRLALHRGDTLVLYTDGLTDARAPQEILTELDLAALLSRGRGLGAEALASFLVQSATAGAEPRDDIALLVVERN